MVFGNNAQFLYNKMKCFGVQPSGKASGFDPAIVGSNPATPAIFIIIFLIFSIILFYFWVPVVCSVSINESGGSFMGKVTA